MARSDVRVPGAEAKATDANPRMIANTFMVLFIGKSLIGPMLSSSERNSPSRGTASGLRAQRAQAPSSRKNAASTYTPILLSVIFMSMPPYDVRMARMGHDELRIVKGLLGPND